MNQPVSKEEYALSLAEALTALQKNPEKTKTLGQSGRNFVEKNYRREKIAEELNQFLSKLTP
jgi:glycosyltransferase involved in cell wall biosynthesis